MRKIPRVFAAGLLAVALPAAAVAAPLHLVHGSVDPAVQKSDAWKPEGSVVLVQATAGAAALRAELLAAGIEVLSYVPENTYIVKLPAGSTTEALKNLPTAAWVGDLPPEYRIAPDLLTTKSAEPVMLEASLWKTEALAEVRELVEAAGASRVSVPESPEPDRIVFSVPPENALTIAAHDAVRWVAPAQRATLRVSDSAWVVQTNVSGNERLWDAGLLGQGEIIGLSDDGLDLNSCFFEDLQQPQPGPDHRKVVAYFGNQQDASHGSLVAGILAGRRVNDSTANQGLAPEARIAFSRYPAFDFTADLVALFGEARDVGAFIHSNSWGNDFATGYTPWSRDIDEFTHVNEDHLVLFAVTNEPNLRTPENAKNVVAVSGTANAPNQDNYGIGGVGPTNDGRIKPEISAPGISITAGGRGDGCFLYVGSGTSYAAPAVAGVAALYRQYLREGWYPGGVPGSGASVIPSGALLKAMLLNGTADMPGSAFEPEIDGWPGTGEGWGRLLADSVLYFPGDSRQTLLHERRHAEGLAAGEHHLVPFVVEDSAEELRVTLVWSDFPAENSALPAIVNDLDLIVTAPGGAIYHGNVFSSGFSATGGLGDDINTVEQIRIAAPEAGTWTVTVTGDDVPMGPQGYAVVASGSISEDSIRGSGQSDLWMMR